MLRLSAFAPFIYSLGPEGNFRAEAAADSTDDVIDDCDWQRAENEGFGHAEPSGYGRAVDRIQDSDLPSLMRRQAE